MTKEGDSERAAEVKKLRKPSVPVWAINQLARAEKAKVTQLLKQEDALRKAHGRSEQAFRDALAAERTTVRELVQDAELILIASGRKPSQDALDRVSSTLHAAAADPAHRDELAQGRLTDELEPPGFEALAGVTLPNGRRGLSRSLPREPTTKLEGAGRGTRGSARPRA